MTEESASVMRTLKTMKESAQNDRKRDAKMAGVSNAPNGVFLRMTSRNVRCENRSDGGVCCRWLLLLEYHVSESITDRAKIVNGR